MKHTRTAVLAIALALCLTIPFGQTIAANAATNSAHTIATDAAQSISRNVVAFSNQISRNAATRSRSTGRNATASIADTESADNPLPLDLADQCFLDFISTATDYKGEIKYTHSPLYNQNLKITGRQYDFTIGNVKGYALLAEIKGVNETFYEVEELFNEKESPFKNCKGLPVFITHRVYLDYKNNAFYNVIDNAPVSETLVAELAYKGFGYYGGGAYVEKIQTVSYSTKTTESYSIPYDLPNYFGRVNEVTGCANTAGAIVIGYYDRFFENLIPNYKSYIKVGKIIRYKTGTDEVLDLVEQLYQLMGTDVAHLGTTFTEFQNGMSRYVTDKGYTYSTIDVFTDGSFDIEKYKISVQNEKPVALFLSGYALINEITEAENSDTISSGYSADSHVAIGCGYKIDTYYNSNGTVQGVRTYLKVASGSDIYGIGYLNINGLGQMDRAISITIS